MKIQIIKQTLIKTGMICSALIIFCGFLTFLSLSYVSMIEDELKSIKNQTSELKSQARNAQNEFKGLTEASQIYANIPKTRLSSDEGMKSTTERRRILTLLEKNIKETYFLNYFDAELDGKPELDTVNISDFVEIYSNKITFSFGALTDEIAHAVIQGIINQTPGYLQLTSLSLNNKEPFSSTVIDELTSGNTDIVLVEAKAEFIWTTLKTIKANQQEDK